MEQTYSVGECVDFTCDNGDPAGDKDFLSLDMEHPKCMTAAQFFEYVSVLE